VTLAERRPAVVAEIVVADPSSSIHVSPVVIVTGSLTVATFGAAIVTGVLQTQLAAKLDPLCGSNHHQCPASTQGDIDTAGALTTATNALFVASAVMLVTTTVVFLVTYKSHRTSKIGLQPGLAFHF
jgi:hypothetical protein